MNADPRQPEPKISAMIMPAIVVTARRLGVDINGILQQLGISIDLNTITQSTVELKHLRVIFDEVERVSGNPTIGLLIGEEFDFEYLPYLKVFLLSASTFREAFDAVRPTQELVSPYLAQILEENEKETIIKLKDHCTLQGEDDRRNAEMIFAFNKTIVSRLMQRAMYPKAVHFRHSRSDLVPLYKDYFKASIVLNSPANAIIYAREFIDFLLPGAFPEICHQARNLVSQQQADSPLQDGLVQDIKRFLTNSNNTLNASIHQVARALHVSTRTLQRRLAENKQSLVEIRDQIRFQMAVDALKATRYSIKEIGERLGFSDPHCFTRAFKRWSGLTPSAYRKGHPSFKYFIPSD